MTLNRISFLSVLALLAGLTAPARAAEPVITSGEHDFRVVILTHGLEHPWGLAFLPDDRLIRARQLWRVLRLEPEPSAAE